MSEGVARQLAVSFRAWRERKHVALQQWRSEHRELVEWSLLVLFASLVACAAWYSGLIAL